MRATRTTTIFSAAPSMYRRYRKAGKSILENACKDAMRLLHTLIALLIALRLSVFEGPVLVTAQGNLGTYEDRIAVEDVMARYVWAVDSLDADGYVAVFTDDAVIHSDGAISKGHKEIRQIVTSLIKRRDDNKAKGLPTSNLYHMISNVRITFPKPGEALH